MNINPELIAQVVASLQDSNVPVPGATQTVANQVTQAAAADKPAFLSKLGNVVKAVAPTALSFIPGVGPIASKIASAALSTLNDDEWFSEFKGNGASFNELLATRSLEDPNFEEEGFMPVMPLSFRGGMGIFECEINSNSAFTDNFMPSVLAYIRKVTDNVLVDDVEKYTDAFIYASQALAFHFTCQKYLKLSQSQPLNIPQLTAYTTVISPENYAAFTGVCKAIEDWIKGTIKLPYAWTEYLRWRFGTVFYSDNTGKPGLIMYDYLPNYEYTMDDGQNTNRIRSIHKERPDHLSGAFRQIQQAYVQCGRAGADLATSFKGHQQRLSVEEPHYDEKEFNLRCNMTIENFDVASHVPVKEGARVILDSRLDMNAAIQAVLMSTQAKVKDPVLGKVYRDLYTPILVTNYYVSFYVLDYIRYNGDSPNASAPTGWLDISSADMEQIAAYKVVYQMPDIDGSGVELNRTTLDEPVDGLHLLKFMACTPVFNSLQIHNYYSPLSDEYNVLIDAGQEDGDRVIGTFVINPADLSYDTASISIDGLYSIQRAAMRNLTRGDYMHKAESTKAEVKEAVADLIDQSAK